MDFYYTQKVQELRTRVQGFMDDHVIPRIKQYNDETRTGNRHVSFMDDLKELAKSGGLWNLFLPHLEDHEPGTRLSNLEYAPLAEIMGQVSWASEVFNCSAPDTGNMEVLHMFGTPEQKRQWLNPLLNGEIRSAFCMTEPDVASSDATNITTSILRDGDEYVINGRKWWTSNALHPNCKIFILMGKTDPDANSHNQQSMILVPSDAPGVTIERDLSVMNLYDAEGHCEVVFRDVRVPVSNLLGEEGSGFAIAQARLGPGRIHHCMRCIGATEVAIKLMVDRAKERKTFGKYLHQHGVIAEWIAKARINVEQARLLTLKAAWMIDNIGAKEARKEIAMIKVVAPELLTSVVDRAIQTFGGMGVSQDTPLATFYALGRALHLADGPDEVHLQSIAKMELKAHELGCSEPFLTTPERSSSFKAG